MIEKYYDGAIEQVAAGLGTVEKNHLLVRYSGQFSVENLNDTKQLEKKKASFLTSCETSKKQLFLWVHAGSCKSNMNSGQLAKLIEEKGIQGVSSLTFLVGFPDEEDFPSRINACSLSISRMEIDSDLLSLILEEQIYRAYRIIHKEPYHK